MTCGKFSHYVVLNINISGFILYRSWPVHKACTGFSVPYALYCIIICRETVETGKTASTAETDSDLTTWEPANGTILVLFTM